MLLLALPFGLVAVCWLLLAAALVKSSRPGQRARGEAGLVTASLLVVPCRMHASLRANLERFARQDCAGCDIVFVTETGDEDAAVVARAVAAEASACRHLAAGPAEGRAQKNHNLLAALADAGSEHEVVVFCDDDASPADDGWLADFLHHAAGDAAATTTFREVHLPDRPGVGTSLYFFGSAFQRASMGFFERYLWGGGTALPRALLDAVDLDEVWGRAVVDDIALSRALARAGIPVRYAPDHLLVERAPALSVAQAAAWIIRQGQFARYYAPAGFALALVMVCSTLIAPVVAAIALSANERVLASAGLGCALAASITALTFAAVHGRGSPRAAVIGNLLVSPAAVVVAAVGLLACCFRRRVVWGDRSYTMAPGGEVLEVARGSRT